MNYILDMHSFLTATTTNIDKRIVTDEIIIDGIIIDEVIIDEVNIDEVIIDEVNIDEANIDEAIIDEITHLNSRMAMDNELATIKAQVNRLNEELDALKIDVMKINTRAYRINNVMEMFYGYVNTSVCAVSCGIMSIAVIHCVILFTEWDGQRMKL